MEALEPLRRFHFTLPRLFHSDFSQRRSRWRSLPHISKWNRLCNQRDRKGSPFLRGRLLRRRRGIEHRRLGECSTPYSTNHNTMKANTPREASSNEPKMMKNTLNTISPIISLPSNSSNRHLTISLRLSLDLHAHLRLIISEGHSEKKDNRHHLPFLCYIYAKLIHMLLLCFLYAFPCSYEILELKLEERQFKSVGSISLDFK